MRLGPEDEPADPDAAGLRERAEQQPVGLLGASARRDVVRLLEVDRVDLLQPDEVLEVDHAARRRPRALDLLGLEEHVRLGLHLVAADEILVRHLFLCHLFLCGKRRSGVAAGRSALDVVVVSDVRLVRLTLVHVGVHDPAVSDAPAPPVEEMEPHVLRLGRRVQGYRDRDEPEAERPPPHRTRHRSSLSTVRVCQ